MFQALGGGDQTGVLGFRVHILIYQIGTNQPPALLEMTVCCAGKTRHVM